MRSFVEFCTAVIGGGGGEGEQPSVKGKELMCLPKRFEYVSIGIFLMYIQDHIQDHQILKLTPFTFGTMS